MCISIVFQPQRIKMRFRPFPAADQSFKDKLKANLLNGNFFFQEYL